MDAIIVRDLSKRYKNKLALDGVNLTVCEGELFGLLGVNGAGKSTLIKILCGLTRKSGGEVTMGGFDLACDLPKIKEIVDLSPQDTSVAGNLSVYENLNFFASIYSRNHADTVDRIATAFGLNEVLHQRAKTLSGGYKRRLSIAVALVSEPKILFLDEPTLGLDVFSRRELWRIIEALKGKVTIVLTSHYLEEIEHLCDRVAILSHGKVLKVGTVDSIKTSCGASTFEEAFMQLVEGSR